MTEESATPDLAELLRRGDGALSRRDFDEFMSQFAPHAVWDLNAWGIGTFTGVDAIRAFLEDPLESYEEHLVEVEEVLDLGHGVVFPRTWCGVPRVPGGRSPGGQRWSC
jgi:ketosteroid isomerase-like protein